MKGKKNAGGNKLTSCALCTDSHTEESGMAQRIVVVARSVKKLKVGRRGKGGKYVVRQLGGRFGERLERPSSGAEKWYLEKTTKTSRTSRCGVECCAWCEKCY